MKIIKTISILAIISLFYSCKRENDRFVGENKVSSHQDDGFVISKVELKSKKVLDYVRQYWREFENELDVNGVTVLKHNYTMGGADFFISHILYKETVEENPPSGYFILDGKYVLFYSGVENKIKISVESIKILLDLVNNEMLQHNDDESNNGLMTIPMNYDPPVMKISMRVDTTLAQLVGNTPY